MMRIDHFKIPVIKWHDKRYSINRQLLKRQNLIKSKLDLGADDYLVKPFWYDGNDFSRIKAVLRRTSNQEQETHLTIKNLSLDARITRLEIMVKGNRINFLKEFDLLSLLMAKSWPCFYALRTFWIKFEENTLSGLRTVDVHVEPFV